MFYVKGDQAFHNAVAVTKSWPRRTRALRKRLAYEAAMKTKAGLLERLPNGPDQAVYRNSLDVVEVSVGGNDYAYAVRSNPGAVGTSKVDAPNTLLYVRSRPRLTRPDPAVQVLEQYNPWTMDTLPFTPDGTKAIVTSKKVAGNTVTKIRKARRKDEYKWRPALLSVGKAVTSSRTSRIKTPKAVPDIGYAAFRLEFGLGEKPAPHWRPTLQDLKTSGIKRMARNPKIKMLFTNASFTGWKRWEKIHTASKIRPGEARKFVPFQRKLGIRP